MTEAELQDLSRRAAACLSNPLQEYETWAGGYHFGYVDGINRRIWLYESTEACCEIMVRVLWGCGCCISGSPHGAWSVYPGAPNQGLLSEINSQHGNDPMLAYRVAVLKALCALKEGK